MNTSQATAGLSRSPLPAGVDELWDRRAELGPDDAAARAVVTAAVDALDAGEARVAWPDPAGGISVDERAKRAILPRISSWPNPEPRGLNRINAALTGHRRRRRQA